MKNIFFIFLISTFSLIVYSCSEKDDYKSFEKYGADGTSNPYIPDNFTVFSSSLLNQISSGFKEAKNGLFSYYLMKGLEGKADTNKDRKITNKELYTYLDSNISLKATELGREQNPELIGKPNKVLMVYK